MSWRELAAGWAAFGATNLALVLLFFRDYSGLPAPVEAPVDPLIAFIVYITLMVAMFAWTMTKVRSAWVAALALGGSQFLLVNVDMVLRGDRAIETAIASTVMMAVTWSTLALAWQLASRPTLPE